MKPEGKLTIITDYGEGKSRVVDGVSMETVEKLKCCGNCEHYNGRETLNCINYFSGADVCDNWQKEGDSK